MSERKIGMKSARPSSMALRRGAPVKREIEVNWPSFSGAANDAGPFVWMWYSRTRSRSVRTDIASSRGVGVAAAP